MLNGLVGRLAGDLDEARRLYYVAKGVYTRWHINIQRDSDWNDRRSGVDERQQFESARLHYVRCLGRIVCFPEKQLRPVVFQNFFSI